MSHIHEVIDADAHYKIDAITRTIVNVNETKRMLVQGDHNSERLTFEVPRYVDGHDLTKCNVVQVHFKNEDMMQAKASESYYDVTDLHIKNDSEETVVLSWLVEGKATVYAGTLNFSIHFKCVVDGAIAYSWNTTTFEGITIKPVINSLEKVELDYFDVIASLKMRIEYLENANSLVLQDSNTKKRYELYVSDGELKMIEKEE